MKNLQTQKSKRDFSKPKKIRISKISDPKNKPSPPVNFLSSTLPGDIKDYCKPIAKRKPNVCIIHAGTNDLKNKDELSIVENIVEVKELIEKISPRTKTVISTLTNR